MSKQRLDQALVARGLVDTRERAKALIMAGKVFSGERKLDKAGLNIADDQPLEVRGQDHPWVSRGGLKLEQAIAHFALDMAGRVALDVGASTGGFTDVLLARGATRVYAVDVGHGQLAWKLRQDPRVVVLEKTNARHLTREQIPEARFAIAGDGPMFAEVAQAAARLGSTVTMLGARHDVPALLACADASMLCSRLEGNPNVLIESQALGCPVVATRAGGAVDAVIDGETGFLHDVGDAQRMAQSLARLISEPTLRASMSCAAAEFAHRRFGLDRMVTQTAALYR